MGDRRDLWQPGAASLFLSLCQGTARARKCHLDARASLGMLLVQGEGAGGSVWAARNPPEQTLGCPPHTPEKGRDFSINISRFPSLNQFQKLC